MNPQSQQPLSKAQQRELLALQAGLARLNPRRQTHRLAQTGRQPALGHAAVASRRSARSQTTPTAAQIRPPAVALVGQRAGEKEKGKINIGADGKGYLKNREPIIFR